MKSYVQSEFYNINLVFLLKKLIFLFIYRDMNIATNRGNYLLINLLKYRFPNIFAGEQIIYVKNLLSKTLETNGDYLLHIFLEIK